MVIPAGNSFLWCIKYNVHSFFTGNLNWGGSCYFQSNVWNRCQTHNNVYWHCVVRQNSNLVNWKCYRTAPEVPQISPSNLEFQIGEHRKHPARLLTMMFQKFSGDFYFPPCVVDQWSQMLVHIHKVGVNKNVNTVICKITARLIFFFPFFFFWHYFITVQGCITGLQG